MSIELTKIHFLKLPNHDFYYYQSFNSYWINFKPISTYIWENHYELWQDYIIPLPLLCSAYLKDKTLYINPEAHGWLNAFSFAYNKELSFTHCLTPLNTIILPYTIEHDYNDYEYIIFVYSNLQDPKLQIIIGGEQDEGIQGCNDVIRLYCKHK